MATIFTPIYPEYYDVFSKEMEKISSRVIFFDADDCLEEAQGKISGLIRNELNEEYLVLDSGAQVRADRIIVVNGKPGPAYSEYENYGIACHMCIGGKGEI